VPSSSEHPDRSTAGIEGIRVVVWHRTVGAQGPRPKAVVDRLNAALQDAIKDADFKANLARLGAEPVGADRAKPEALQQVPPKPKSRSGGR